MSSLVSPHLIIITFNPDPQADVIVLSSDLTSFSVRRSSLRNGSDVFDGLFAASHPNGEKDSKTGLPIIRVDETEEALDLLLRFITPNQKRPNLLTMPFDVASEILRLGDKFGVELMKEIAFVRLYALAPTHVVQVLELALLHRELSLAQKALSHMDQTRFTQERKAGGIVVFGHSHLISSLSNGSLGSLGIDSLIGLFKLEEKVLTGESTRGALSSSYTFN
ncbi:hypothetical protein BDY24DRAFT_414360 [Mrakia frigida]|uniref:uncharacterized protein n=1 Tax=Mrakia frigida TaxID=29902 RepID=UPI003FCBF70C